MSRERPIARTLLTLLAALVLGAALVHGWAWWQWRASFGGAPYAERLRSAERAAAVEPFNPAFAARPWWVRGVERSRDNRPADAYWSLHRAIDIDPGNAELRKVFKESYAAWAQATTWKAHVQHAREHTGGVLPEKDWIP